MAVKVEPEDQQTAWRAEDGDMRVKQPGMDSLMAAVNDLKGMAKRLSPSSKRKAAPPWSCLLNYGCCC